MSSSRFFCPDCGRSSPKWFGRCPGCGSWTGASSVGTPNARVLKLAQAGKAPQRLVTDVIELDRVLGGGLVPGSVVLLAGDPGIGKSTLTLQMLAGLSRRGRSCLLVSGEESLDQIGMRAGRLELDLAELRVLDSCVLTAILAACEPGPGNVLVVDSIQTLQDPEEDGPPGSVAQVRSSAAALVRFAKSSGMTVVVIGHVTKEGSVAGPKTLEHVVDAVLTIEGDRSGALRLLRASKNRYGSCDEAGVMRMGPKGLEAVPDPSAMLLEDRLGGVPGSVIFPSLEGTRPILVEVQALVNRDSSLSRRVGIGLDPRRLSLLLAVLEQRARVKVENQDVFVALAGGLVVKEPAVDLAICLAVASTLSGVQFPQRTVVVGEVGLAGEVRRVPGIDKRVAEARRLGFDRAILPAGCQVNAAGLTAVRVATVSEAIERMLPAPGARVAS